MAVQSDSIYAVRRGDNAGSIAKKHGITLLQLSGYNPGVNLDKIKEGLGLYVSLRSISILKPNEIRKGYPGSSYQYTSIYTPGDVNNGIKKLDVVRNRYTGAYNGLRRAGYSIEDSLRLASILSALAVLESNWVLANPENNYAGHLYSLDGSGLRKFESEDAFWDAHINNLKNRWPKWNTALNTNDYHTIINHPEIKTLLDYDKLKKSNPDLFIYAPYWDSNAQYMELLEGVYNSIAPYILMLDYTLFKKRGGIFKNTKLINSIGCVPFLKINYLLLFNR